MIVRTTGSGRPLVVLHGFGVDHRIMLPLEEMVGRAPWRRIYLDLPWAEGAPESGVTNTRDLAEAVRTEISEHLGTEPFAVIGNSYGGLLARYVAHELRTQVLGLATLAGVFETRHDARTLPPRTALRIDPAAVARAGEAQADFTEISVVQTAETLAAFTTYVLPGLRGADQATMDLIAADYDLPATPETAHPAPFTSPTLHLFGRQDDVVGYEDGWRVRDHYPRGSYAVLDMAGHNAHLERPTVTAALVRDWLDRMDAEPR